MDTLPYRTLNRCTICENDKLQEIISLPRFPFTGIYCSKESELPHFVYEGVDQGLMLCSCCGHAQLKSVILPSLVYDHTYSHRGSESSIAKQGNEFFAGFLEELFPGRIFRKILDVGCNDGYLLRQLESKGESLLGIDPIWIGKDHELSPKISIVGNFIENTDLQQVLGDSPDLVVSAHAFEHIEQPKQILEKILSQVKDDTVLIIEVPSFDTLLSNHRFDQVFHQHIQYFSLASFYHQICSLNCRYLAHKFNYSMWGGTMLFAFQKGKASDSSISFPKISKEDVLSSFSVFTESLKQLAKTLVSSSSKKIVGFGAAQMLPSLAYHAPDHLSQIEEIIDDNVSRQGLHYPNLHFKIISPDQINLEESDVVITALDSSRPILERLLHLKPRRILMPINVV